jgi:uncharacterized protein (TIGR02118 family)
MIKLTVLYNLPPGADHEEFVEWRIGPHQQANVQMPGLIKTDFYSMIDGREGKAPFRYITELYFRDLEAFENAFYDPEHQIRLQKSLERVADPLFLISREVMTEELPRG